MNRAFQIKTKSAQHHLDVLKALYGLGYKYHGDINTAEEAAKKYGYIPYNWLVLRPDYAGGPYISGNSSETPSYLILSGIDELIEKTLLLEVTLNDEYKAVIRSDKSGIDVGCQFIPTERLKDLFYVLKQQGIIAA